MRIQEALEIAKAEEVLQRSGNVFARPIYWRCDRTGLRWCEGEGYVQWVKNSEGETHDIGVYNSVNIFDTMQEWEVTTEAEL